MNFQVVHGNPAEAPQSPAHAVQSLSRFHRKRPTLAERGIALFVLITFSPVLALFAALITFGGQKPLFLQDRVGYRGELFRIFKFRTIPDRGWRVAERRAQGNGIMQARLALFRRVSTVLRKTGLDELPQFANILKGDMQIIGPRPLIVQDFIALPEGRMGRCVVPPGITGFAQVNGGQELDSESKLALDLYLIGHMSPRLVVKIVTRTVLRILGVTAATDRICSIDLKRAQAHAAGQSATFEAMSQSVMRENPWRADAADRLPAQAKVAGSGQHSAQRDIKDVSLGSLEHHQAG